MDLRTPYTLSLLRNGYLATYPSRGIPARTDVVVVGAGITGALTASMLAASGMEAVVLEKRHPGMGSTAASTAMLQYEIDEPLHSLIDKCGRQRAEKSYLACYEAIADLEEILARHSIDADFRRVPSLQYASFKKDVNGLKKERAARRALGFDVDFLEPDELRQEFGFSSPGGLLSANGAQVDPYKVTHGLLNGHHGALTAYDLVEVLGVAEEGRGVRVDLAGGGVVRAKRAVLACGYETLKFLPFSVATVGATYAFASKPISEASFWKDKALVWETKDPYLYFRSTADNRVLAGGRDDPSNNKDKRNAALGRKVRALLDDLDRLFPHLELVADFTWAGAFASTKDSLGYVDTLPGTSRIFCNLGFGGNGILFSLVGARIIRDRILGRKNAYTDVFSFGR